MKLLLMVFGIILLLSISAMLTQIHYFANVGGFIAAIGFMLVFFQDPQKNLSEEESLNLVKFKKYWYFVFGFGFFFSFIFGSLWNNQMGGMV